MKLKLLHQTCFVAAISLALSLDPEIQRIIDTVIERTFIPHHHITGLGLAIVKDNGTTALMSKGYGYRNTEDGISVNSDTLFGIGSISKSFTATLVVKTLSERFPELGESALDIPVRTLWPEFNFTLSDRFRSESTSLRDLLSHKICLLPESFGLTVGVSKTKQEFLYRQRYAEEVCPFRTNFVYNNGGVFMAGEVVAAIANSTFEEMLTNLFRDIGMSDTTFIRDSDDYENMPNMSRTYYRENGTNKRFNDELLKRVSVAVGSGGILSTSNDMIKYLMFHLNNGKVGSQQIVSEEAMKYIRRSSNPFPFQSAKTKPGDIIDGDIGYGLGINVGLFDGWERLSHGGYLPPFESFLSLYPALNLGIYTVTNGPGALINRAAGHSYLHRQIFDIIQKGVNYDASANNCYTTPNVNASTSFPMPKSLTVPKVKAPVSRIEPEDVVGLYGNGFSGEFVISIPNNLEAEDGDLYIQYGVWGTGILSRRSNTSFILQYDSDITQEFWASGTPEIETFVDFREKNLAILIFGEESLAFEKDLTLDKLPAQPWDSDSCGQN